jgi:hypothetical protein
LDAASFSTKELSSRSPTQGGTRIQTIPGIRFPLLPRRIAAPNKLREDHRGISTEVETGVSSLCGRSGHLLVGDEFSSHLLVGDEISGLIEVSLRTAMALFSPSLLR